MTELKNFERNARDALQDGLEEQAELIGQALKDTAEENFREKITQITALLARTTGVGKADSTGTTAQIGTRKEKKREKGIKTDANLAALIRVKLIVN